MLLSKSVWTGDHFSYPLLEDISVMLIGRKPLSKNGEMEAVHCYGGW